MVRIMVEKITNYTYIYIYIYTMLKPLRGGAKIGHNACKLDVGRQGARHCFVMWIHLGEHQEIYTDTVYIVVYIAYVFSTHIIPLDYFNFDRSSFSCWGFQKISPPNTQSNLAKNWQTHIKNTLCANCIKLPNSVGIVSGVANGRNIHSNDDISIQHEHSCCMLLVVMVVYEISCQSRSNMFHIFTRSTWTVFGGSDGSRRLAGHLSPNTLETTPRST